MTTRKDLEAMKKEEYYNSPQRSLLSFFHKGAFKIVQEAQDLKNILNLVAAEFELWGDKYCLVDQQIKLVKAEVNILMKHVSNLSEQIEPRRWSDWENGRPIPIPEQNLSTEDRFLAKLSREANL